MFLYTNKFGQNVMCHGTDDMRKADGVNIDLRQMVVTDESGALIGVQGGSMSLQKSMPLIKAMKEEILMKAQRPAVMKKSFSQAKPAARSSQLQKSFSNGLANLHREMSLIKAMQG